MEVAYVSIRRRRRVDQEEEWEEKWEEKKVVKKICV